MSYDLKLLLLLLQGSTSKKEKRTLLHRLNVNIKTVKYCKNGTEEGDRRACVGAELKPTHENT